MSYTIRRGCQAADCVSQGDGTGTAIEGGGAWMEAATDTATRPFVNSLCPLTESDPCAIVDGDGQLVEAVAEQFEHVDRYRVGAVL